MPDSRSFSDGVDRFLERIRPHGRLATSHPMGLALSEARRIAGETLHGWFVRLVGQFCGDDEQIVALEPNLAVFARCLWTEGGGLRYANIQTLYTTCELDRYYLGEEAEAAYLRLDFDYQTLGDPFSHPLAHVHVEGDLSPRFSLDGGDSGNIIVDYLEFLYRTYFPDAWFKWVRREWGRERARLALADSDDPLPGIVEAFASNNFQELRGRSTDIDRMKRMLRERKDAIFKHHMEGPDRIILEYPAAR